eukprot:Hpha_TRINITY_DN8933_c0_g1::TRINITY_DN8933_c0_g1_i1::g.80781::m.80781
MVEGGGGRWKWALTSRGWCWVYAIPTHLPPQLQRAEARTRSPRQRRSPRREDGKRALKAVRSEQDEEEAALRSRLRVLSQEARRQRCERGLDVVDITEASELTFSGFRCTAGENYAAEAAVTIAEHVLVVSDSVSGAQILNTPVRLIGRVALTGNRLLLETTAHPAAAPLRVVLEGKSTEKATALARVLALRAGLDMNNVHAPASPKPSNVAVAHVHNGIWFPLNQTYTRCLCGRHTASGHPFSSEGRGQGGLVSRQADQHPCQHTSECFYACSRRGIRRVACRRRGIQRKEFISSC